MKRLSATELRETIRHAERRRADLQRAIGKAFPEFARVSVELGTFESVYPDGTPSLEYSFAVKLYVEGDESPTIGTTVMVNATDEEVASAVEAALARISGGMSER